MTHDQKDEAEPVEAEAVAWRRLIERLFDCLSDDGDPISATIDLEDASDLIGWARKAHGALTSRDERIAVAEAENAKLRALSEEAIRLMTKYAREAGEATGKLETSELAGIVDDWKARALRAEALLKEAEAVLRRTYDHIGKTPEYHRGEGAVDLMRDAGLLSARIYSTIRACKEGEG